MAQSSIAAAPTASSSSLKAPLGDIAVQLPLDKEDSLIAAWFSANSRNLIFVAFGFAALGGMILARRSYLNRD